MFSDNKILHDGVVVLSGASGGLGRAIVELLIKRYSCSVIGIGRNEEKLKALKKLYGDSFSYYIFDVSQKENWDNFAIELQENKRKPNVLINNAGILPNFESFGACGSDAVEKVLGINFLSCVYSVQALLPMLKTSDKKSAIINVSSSAALCPLAGTSGYSASKGALKNFTQALSEELRGRVFVGLVMPGFCKTEIFRNQRHNKDVKIIDMIASDPQKTARKMLRGISHGKRRIITGWDAKMMNVFTKVFPTFSLRVYAWVIRVSGLELFSDVFK